MKIAFVERECAVGGVSCGAWCDWFVACDDADPKAIDEDRDPRPLEDFTFKPSECAEPGKCRLYGRIRPAPPD